MSASGLRSATAPTLLACMLVALSGSSATVLAADAHDALSRARSLYNERKYDEAISAAEQARTNPAYANSADLVAARAYLERFRESAASDDLTNARDRLRQIDPHRFPDRERAEFLVGLGETLFFDEAYGAAAALFDAALSGPDPNLSPEAREHVLDWWASALDRDARPRPDLDRQAIYVRIRDRMRGEVASHPASAAAAYWSAASSWAQGDLQTAWAAAEAGWARAPLTADYGEELRADLDRLMLRGIIPDRAKVLAVAPETLRLDWEQFKEKWKR